MATYVLSCALPARCHPAIVVALAFCVIVAPAAANGDDHGISGTETQAASVALSSGSSAREAAAAQAAVEESSDWREILPGLTMGSQLRLRTESRRNAKFDGARAGNDEDYLLSRFRLPRRTTLRVALQDFVPLSPGADAWYNVGGAVVHHAGDAAISSHVGNELDITVRLPVGPVGLDVGYGRFFGRAYLRDADFALDTADFFYLQTMVGF